MCTGHDPNEACSWPKKTVRASIALIIIPTIIFFSCAMMIMFFIKGQYESALGILSALSGIAGTVIGYYFGSRSAESAADTISNMEHDIIESKNREIEFRNHEIEIQSRNLSYQNPNNTETVNN